MEKNIRTLDDLKLLQNLPLDLKIAKTKVRIREWVSHFGAENCYISFSGGKDSTVLLDLVRSEYPEIEAVFIDTGLEYPEVKEFVKGFDNVIKLRPDMNFREVILTYGYPIIGKDVAASIYDYRRKPDGDRAKRFDPNSEYNKKYKNMFSLVRWTWLRDSDIPISSKCCEITKKRPVKKYEKETGKKGILGTLATESNLRKESWLKNGCNAFDSKRPLSQPLSFWTEQDILQYIYEHELPIASVYGNVVINSYGRYETTGVDRTGCVFCGFGVHREKSPNRYQLLYTTHPKLWDYCMKPVENGGLGFQSVIEAIGVKTKPEEDISDKCKERNM